MGQSGQESRSRRPLNFDKGGWGRPNGSRKWHYFPAFDHSSLCNDWYFYGGDLMTDYDGHPQACQACLREKKELDTQPRRRLYFQ